MKFSSAVVSAAFILGLAGVADAGGYVSLGTSSDADITGDLGDHFDANGSDGGRISIGQRTGRIAFEATLFGTDMVSTTSLGGGMDYSTVSLGVDAKYFFPLAGQLEAYGKAGLNKTWIVADSEDAGIDYSGRGYNLGAGLQYGFSLSFLADAAIWLDYNVQKMELHEGTRASLDGGTNMLSVGLTIGF